MSHSACLNCGRDEQQSPLISLRFRGENWFICPQCMPVLIHNPQRLVEKLPGAGDLAPAPAHKE
jgi:hypothetical protein